VIVEPGDPIIRPELLQEFEQKIEDESRQETSRKVYIVQFYDARRTWGVVVETDMALLAEDKKIDQDMLSGRKRSRFKTKDMKRECRRAYEQAIGDLEVPPVTASILDGDDSKP